MENLCRLFFHHQKIEVLENCLEAEGEIIAGTFLRSSGKGTELTVTLKTPRGYDEKKETLPLQSEEQEIERKMGVFLFELLSAFCGIRPKWGILTGVRPVKLLRSLTEKYGEEKAVGIFREQYLVTKEKADLSLKTMKNEGKILARSHPDSFSLYISIPFCPTRCSYCSFVSSSVEKSVKLMPDYVERLAEEIRFTDELPKIADCAWNLYILAEEPPRLFRQNRWICCWKQFTAPLTLRTARNSL